MSYKQSKNGVLESRTWKITFPIGIGTKIDPIKVLPPILKCALTVLAIETLMLPLNTSRYAFA